MQGTIDAGWNLDEPFVLSGQAWLGELVSRGSPHPELRDFLLSFVAAFDVSTYKHTLGRAQKRISEDLAAARSTIVTHLKDDITASLTELRLPLVQEEGVDEMQHVDLIAACAVNVFCMAAGSNCTPSFEANEVAHVTCACPLLFCLRRWACVEIFPSQIPGAGTVSKSKPEKVLEFPATFCLLTEGVRKPTNELET